MSSAQQNMQIALSSDLENATGRAVEHIPHQLNSSEKTLTSFNYSVHRA